MPSSEKTVEGKPEAALEPAAVKTRRVSRRALLGIDRVRCRHASRGPGSRPEALEADNSAERRDAAAAARHCWGHS